MNQSKIGKFISQKRKEKNLTQAQLAEKLGVSNKSVSKWETGKCMPDYSIIQRLCDELDISVSELVDGEEQEKDSIRLYDAGQMLDMIERVQLLEYQKELLSGLSVVIVGLILLTLSFVTKGEDSRGFVSGLLLGLSSVLNLLGIILLAKTIYEQKKK